MMNGGQEFPSVFSQDDKFFSRLSSRGERYNSSKQGEASFRVLYYGGAAGSVPFLWESQPGTPKHQLSDSPLPPLTPPPQYLQSSPIASPSLKKKHSKIFNSNLARTLSKKISAATSPPSSYSSSYSSPSTPFHSGKDSEKAGLSSICFELEEEEYVVGRDSPTSTLCFRARNSGSSCRRSKGYHGHPMKSVKKVVKCIAGRRHF